MVDSQFIAYPATHAVADIGEGLEPQRVGYSDDVPGILLY